MRKEREEEDEVLLQMEKDNRLHYGSGNVPCHVRLWESGKRRREGRGLGQRRSL
ncbi:MAG: hypothetical protein HFH97_13170 [Lachnospiraceae bacterium]|nr:hypothetical protein [Lachnospiraceae bacterium]